MRVIDRCAPDSRQNIALDATLFSAVERGEGDETLRFWEAPRPAVIVGWFGDVAAEVEEHACRADGIPVIRRISGGGAVIVGAGCLNYSLVLSLDARPELRDVGRSYTVVLGWVAEALATPGLIMAGASDLALCDRKVAGSAQRRGRRALLHHGSVLYAFEVPVMERYLKHPPRQPAYRAERRHSAFVTNAPIEPRRVKAALIRRLAA